MNKVEKKLREIILLCESTKDVDSYKGSFFSSALAGSIFLLSQYKLDFETNKYDELLKQKIEEFISIDLAKMNITYCEGITGYAWLLNYLKKNQIIDIDISKFLSDIDLLAYKGALKQLKQKNYDFLHGAIGNLYYLSGRTDSKKVRKYLEILLVELKKQSSASSKGLCWVKLEKGEDIIDLGLSHGIASNIVLFSKLMGKNILPELVKEMLSETVKFMLNSKNVDQTYSVFPNYTIRDEININHDSSLRWCYGDFGISLALLQAGEALNDVNLKNEAIDVCLKTIHLTKDKDTRIYDVGLCHGSSGAAHLYNRMYYYTKDVRFKTASDYWIKKTLDMSSDNKPLAGYDKYYLKFPENNLGFLTGLSGVGLVLLSIISDKEPIWDSCLLIS